MRPPVRLITTLAITALIASTGTAHAEPRFAPAKSSAEYIAALQALPEAYRAIDAAKANALTAVAGISDALHILRNATLTEAAAAQHVTAAQQAVDTEQANMDDMARTMYMAGGAATPLDPFLAEPDSPQSLTRAMDTYTYLKGASDQQVANYQTAQAAMAAAKQAQAEAQAAVLAAQTTVDQSTLNARNAEQAVTAARDEYQRLQYVTSTNPDVKYTLPKDCKNWLVKELANAGFEGEDLREAWAIVMRESGGANVISATGDYGAFQINKKTYGDVEDIWISDEMMLNRTWNLHVGAVLSDYGRSWLPWGLDGHGRPNPLVYVRSGWTEEMIQDRIVEPYVRFYSQYPCRPASEREAEATQSATQQG